MKLTSLPKRAFKKNAEIYRLLANPFRLEIFNNIRNAELTVSELVSITGLRKANVSQHLALLRSSSLVRSRSVGVNVFYHITDPRIVEPCHILHTLRSSRKFLAGII
ncbi:MAG: transcriptional regulator [Candidatus Harrisonbacteria bacterium CG10_big_fil_rev_8_21_14_0_10_42_17]|uniref:Transcriptional regulator n=1 Tax=Candidatus Harrisonbacteria bacterium CG10_big_fil_rev_8_21_14_0_10_42_17 TaxID=1974584 RepID=A0A2M6WHQ8_9BACT|nr:MAG: transcriptional regulator [Candidatus Harrisonbacteria bacterium CG10_big_fil_rev_8_21_14_0_10_42_17]